MPGDELLPHPTLTWDHGLTIHARPAEVWPWIAQIGDDRGGFYSYTFIENLIAREKLYHNADRVWPEFQDPRPGEGLIDDYMTVRAVEPGRYLLANLEKVPEMGFTWIWHLYPASEDETRLVVCMRVQAAPELAFTFLQPPLWIRGLVDALLLGGVTVLIRSKEAAH